MFTVERNTLLKSLQKVVGVIEQRQTMPILANILLTIEGRQLSLISTDLEIELMDKILLEDVNFSGSITIPGRKLLDICKVLPEDSILSFLRGEDTSRIVVRFGSSRFVLSSLCADEYPKIDWDKEANSTKISIKQEDLLKLLRATQFAMAQQDVRYSLNGLFLEIKNDTLRAVATDGHRLSTNIINMSESSKTEVSVIVPRKGILELVRLLKKPDDTLELMFSKSHIRLNASDFVFSSKLIDGRFPNYEKVIIQNGTKELVLDRDKFKASLSRVAVLSSHIVKGVKLQILNGFMKIVTRNQGQEEAEEEMEVEYTGTDLSIGFNIDYLMDILTNMDSEKILMKLNDSTTSVLIKEFQGSENICHIIMPLQF